MRLFRIRKWLQITHLMEDIRACGGCHGGPRRLKAHLPTLSWSIDRPRRRVDLVYQSRTKKNNWPVALHASPVWRHQVWFHTIRFRKLLTTRHLIDATSRQKTAAFRTSRSFSLLLFFGFLFSMSKYHPHSTHAAGHTRHLFIFQLCSWQHAPGLTSFSVYSLLLGTDSNWYTLWFHRNRHQSELERHQEALRKLFTSSCSVDAYYSSSVPHYTSLVCYNGLEKQARVTFTRHETENWWFCFLGQVVSPKTTLNGATGEQNLGISITKVTAEKKYPTTPFWSFLPFFRPEANSLTARTCVKVHGFRK